MSELQEICLSIFKLDHKSSIPRSQVVILLVIGIIELVSVFDTVDHGQGIHDYYHQGSND